MARCRAFASDVGPEGVRQGCLPGARAASCCRELTIVERAIGPSASCPLWCGGRVARRAAIINHERAAALLERALGTVYEHHHDCDHMQSRLRLHSNLTGWRRRKLLCPHHWSTTLKAPRPGQIMSFFQSHYLHHHLQTPAACSATVSRGRESGKVRRSDSSPTHRSLSHSSDSLGL